MLLRLTLDYHAYQRVLYRADLLGIRLQSFLALELGVVECGDVAGAGLRYLAEQTMPLIVQLNQYEAPRSPRRVA